MGGIRRYCGIAEEVTYGQTPAPAAAVHLDITGSTLDPPADTNIIYDGGARRSARIYRPGFYAPAGNVVYGADIRTVGWFLKWVLGNYLFTTNGGTGTLNLHEFYGSHDTILPSFCARVGKDIFEHVFSGCILNSLEINVGDALCMLTADIVAQKDSKAALEEGELLFPDEYPLAFHEVTAYLIGTPDTNISAKVKELTLSINNNASADQGRHVGNRHPARIPANDRETTLTMEMFHEDTAMLERLWGASTGPAAAGSTEYGIKLVIDSGEYGSLTITLPKVVNTHSQQQPSGRSEMGLSVPVRALMDNVTLSDASEVETEIFAELENNQDDMDSGS
jgi:hypothetical protein